MEQHNIEKLVKEAIKDRNIEPSLQARERLITALNSEPKKKKHVWIYYALVAAVLILLYIVGSQVQNENLNPEVRPEITFEKYEVESNAKKTQPEDYTIQTEVSNNEVAHQSKDKASNKLQINKVAIDEGKTVKSDITTTISDSLVDNQLLAHKTNSIKNALQNTVVNASNEIDSTSNMLKKAYAFITPEHLLAEVETDSSSKLRPSSSAKTKNYVGSNQLLLEMERQLFDEQNKSIFKKAGHQLKKVKTAVANRNFKD